MTDRSIFITGGAGFFGRTLAEHCATFGWEVTVYDRVPPDPPFASSKIRFVKGDILDAVPLRQALEGHEVVVHNAAVLPVARAGRDYFRVNVEGTRRVLEGTQALGLRKVLFISSSAVFGIPHQVPITEETPLTPLGRYGHSKAEAERVCGEYKKRGLDITILRPRTLVGPGRLGIFSLLFDRIRTGRRVPLLGRGDNRFQLLSSRDLAMACGFAASETSFQEDFNLGASEFGTVREDLGALIQHAGSSSRLTPVPVLPTQVVLRILDALRLSPLVDWHYRTPHKPFFFDCTKAERLLGWRPKDSNQVMLSDTYDWYLERLNRGPLGFGDRHTLAARPGVLR